MKKVIVVLGLVCLLATSAMAKYKYPEGATTTGERRINREIKSYDSDVDGKLSKEEFLKKRKSVTREDRRMERRARKNGTYITPEEEFKRIDKDGDGVISTEELRAYRSNTK